MSASVGVSPWQNVPVAGSRASRVSNARSPTSHQCAYQVSRAVSVAPSVPVRYFSTRRLLSGWISQAIASASERTRARSTGVPGSSGGADWFRRATR